MLLFLSVMFFFFFNDTATTEIYTLSLHDALPISAAPRKSAQREPRFVGDLWQSDRGPDLRAGVLWRGPARDRRSRSRAHRLSRHHPDWLRLFAFHSGDGPRPALAGCEHRGLHRAGAKSDLGFSFHRRAAIGLGDYWRRDHHYVSHESYADRGKDQKKTRFATKLIPELRHLIDAAKSVSPACVNGCSTQLADSRWSHPLTQVVLTSSLR